MLSEILIEWIVIYVIILACLWGWCFVEFDASSGPPRWHAKVSPAKFPELQDLPLDEQWRRIQMGMDRAFKAKFWRFLWPLCNYAFIAAVVICWLLESTHLIEVGLALGSSAFFLLLTHELWLASVKKWYVQRLQRYASAFVERFFTFHWEAHLLPYILQQWEMDQSARSASQDRLRHIVKPNPTLNQAMPHPGVALRPKSTLGMQIQRGGFGAIAKRFRRGVRDHQHQPGANDE